MNPTAATRAESPSEMPAFRRWGALLLGALAIVPFGAITALASPDALGIMLGVGLAASGVYIAAGAFIPRLLRFGGPAVPLPIVISTIIATISLAEGRPGSGAMWLAVAALVAIISALSARR